ncbi:MAG: hypothetical protein LBQ35_08725 [Spirochaetaceae bacterium]|nr:hypothetical protein [Spirochaetaceae bacterium]
MGEFTFPGLGQEEARIIEALLESYLSGRGTLVRSAAVPEEPQEEIPEETPDDVDETGGGVSAAPPETLDYSLSFVIREEEAGRVLEMQVENLRTGELARYTGVYRSTGELALRARGMMETAFAPARNQGAGEGPGFSPASSRVYPTERGILGAWRGDRGIAMIRFFPQGRGMALFLSGVQMELSWRIEEGILLVDQVSPNHERYYHPAPYDEARRLVREAEPMHWELALFEGGSVLRGIRRAIGAHPGGDAEAGIAGEQETEWTRSPPGRP